MSTIEFGDALVGREQEGRCLVGLVGRIRDRGASIVLCGDAGIGKTALLREAIRAATAAELRILVTTGVQSEARMPFAALHQLLCPILDRARRLPVPQRDAVLTAFGMADAAAPDLFLIALATLNLLAEAAMDVPILLIVEDAHWLDQSSVEVLAFVARRLESEPVVLMGAMRGGFSRSLDGAGLTELHLEPLDDAAAAALLDARAPRLSPGVRERVLGEAAGNPLALVELPIAVDPIGDAAMMPAWLPLTTRLEQAFADRVAGLPPVTRTLLRVAAVNDGDVLSETLDAGSLVAGDSVTLEDLVPAVVARLVEVSDERLRFRHPLMRSAIYQAASISQRYGAHAALATVLDGDLDRRVWHRAASSRGPDEAVAVELEAAATRAQRQGGIGGAVAALDRAARLSGDSGRRGVRLLRAAEFAAEQGRREVVLRLLRQAEPLELSERQRARMAWIRDTFDDGIRDIAHGTQALAGLAERVAADGDTDLAMKLLWGAALRCFFAEPGPQVRGRVVSVAERVSVVEHDPRLLAILGFVAPVERGAVIVEQLHRWVARPDEDAPTARLLANAAMAVGEFDLAMAVHARAVAGLRAQGRLGLLARALSAQAWSALQLVDLGVAIPAGEEAGRLATETSQPNLRAVVRAHEAAVAALRGDHDGAERLAADAERASMPVGARPALAVVQLARGYSALGAGRHAEAYEHLRRMHDPADPAFHLGFRCSAVGDLVDAATHSGRREAIRGFMDEMEEIGRTSPSPSLHAGLRYARALMADDSAAERYFEDALRVDLTRWPFARARAQLAFGEWLRRRRRPADSRRHLRAARDTFDALGTIPWGERARQELRATGESSSRHTPKAHEQLTPQELQIAQMAAAGLTNREIGEKLYVSPRTISSHLYRIFPKLGVASRSELSAAIRVPA